MRKTIPIMFWAAAALVLSTCGTLQDVFREPKLSFHSVELKNITFEGINMLARVNVENPNGFDIPFPAFDWELFVDAASFLKGKAAQDSGKLKSRGSGLVNIPLNFTYQGLYQTFASILENNKENTQTPFRVAVAAKFPLPLIQDKVFNIKYDGKLPLLKMPRISPGSVRIENLSFTGLDLAMGIKVENPNEFPIPFPRGGWDFAVGGASFLKSSLSESGPVAAKTVHPAEIKLRLNYAELLTSIRTLANSNEARTVLALDAGFPIPAFESVKNKLNIPGSIPVLRKPEISFKGISLKTPALSLNNLAGLGKLEFDLAWEVENRNSFTVKMENFLYDIKLNSSALAGGRIASPPQLRPNTKTAVPLTVTVDSPGAIKALGDMINRGAVSYQAGGSLGLSGDYPGLEKIALPFDFSGNTNLKR
jgi:LEA14-like dessication related protein